MIRNWLELTQKDFANLNKSLTWALIPISSVEQHGLHLPVGTDSLIMMKALAEIKDKVKTDRTLIQLPQLFYGKSTEHTNYPGTITLTYESIQSVLYDIVASLARMDIRNVIIFNSHGGNSGLLQAIAYDMRMKYQVNTFAVGISGTLRKTNHDPLLSYPHSMHAGYFETSLLLHWFPDLVDRAEIPTQTLSTEGAALYSKIGDWVDWGWATEDLSPTGYIGSPQLASAEKGKEIAAELGDALVDVIETIIHGA